MLCDTRLVILREGEQEGAEQSLMSIVSKSIFDQADLNGDGAIQQEELVSLSLAGMISSHLIPSHPIYSL